MSAANPYQEVRQHLQRAHDTAREALADGWRHPMHGRLVKIPARIRAVLAALDRLEASTDEGSTP